MQVTLERSAWKTVQTTYESSLLFSLATHVNTLLLYQLGTAFLADARRRRARAEVGGGLAEEVHVHVVCGAPITAGDNVPLPRLVVPRCEVQLREEIR